MNPRFEIINLREYQINVSMERELCSLLGTCFPEAYDGTRSYFKLRPYFRLLVVEGDSLLGQLGVDCRVIKVGSECVNVFGMIDLSVFPEHQGKGFGSKLLNKAEMIARENDQDFMVLMADSSEHSFYEKLGYQHVQAQDTKWLAIEERSSVKLLIEDLSECFMVKPLGENVWPIGNIDMLGYLF